MQKGISHMFVISAKLRMKNSSNTIIYFELLSCAQHDKTYKEIEYKMLKSSATKYMNVYKNTSNLV